jgi:hypothetical protein
MQLLALEIGASTIEALKGHDLKAQGAALGNGSFWARKP